MMNSAGLRKSLLAAPLMWGALGCSSTFNWEPLTQFPAKSHELPAEHLTAMARLLERQGRLQSAKHIYSDLAKRAPNDTKIARRMELIAAYERKQRGEESPLSHQPPGAVPANVAESGTSSESTVVSFTTEPNRLSAALDEAPVRAIRPRVPDTATIVDVASDEASDVLEQVAHETPPFVEWTAESDHKSDDVQVAVAGNEELERFVSKLNAVRRLLDRLQSPDSQIRQNAAASLAETSPRTQPVLAALTPLLDDPDAQVRVRAAHAVLELDGPCNDVLPVLAESITDQEPAVAGMAAFLVGRIGQPAQDLMPALRAQLLAESPLVAVHVAEAIVILEPTDREATDVLLLLLSSPEEDVRWLAACALEATADAGSSRVVQALEAALRDGSPKVRSAAALSLGAFSERVVDAVPQLWKALFDADPRVRKAAETALARINPHAGTVDAVQSQTD